MGDAAVTTLRRLILALALCAWALPARAQQTTIRATDPSSGADVQSVGDATNNALRVTLTSPSTVTVSGTVTANQGGSWSVAQSGSWLVQGLVAHGASYSGNPLPIGCYASASAPTSVSDGQIARMWCLTNGALSVNLANASIAATQSGTWNITNISGTVSLPTGAATAANQTTGNTSLSNIDGKLPALVTGRVPVDGSGVTQPVSQSGTWSLRMQDGSGNAVTSASRGSERALTVQVVDASGAQVTSFGGSSSNAAASATGSAVPSSASYSGINVGGTLRGWTGLSLGSHYAGTVAIVDGSGNQITSFGGSGGTASNYTSAFPSTGTAVGFSDGTNMQGARVFDGDTGVGTQYVLGAVLRKSASGGTVEAGTSSDPLRIDPTGTTTQPVSGTVTANQGGAWSATVTQGTATNLKTQAENYQGGVAVSSSNPLQVTLANTGANSTAVKVDGSAVTQPVSGSITANAGTGTFANQQSNQTADYDTGAGTQTTTMWGIALPASGGPVAGGTATNPIQVSLANTAANSTAVKVDGSAVTQPVSVSGTVAFNQTQVGGNSVSTGNGTAGAGVQRVTVASDNTAFQTIPVATADTTNGLSTCYLSSAASTNSTNCKSSAGNVYVIHVTNTTTTNYFLRLYDASSAPTCSSSTGFVETIPALGAAANGGINGRSMSVPDKFSNGIGFCLTGGGSSTDNTNAATGVFVTIKYR